MGLAADLGRWFQLARVRGHVRQAEPKPLPWRLWHVPARLVRSGPRTILRVLDLWPHANPLLGAYRRLALLILLTRPAPATSSALHPGPSLPLEHQQSALSVVRRSHTVRVLPDHGHSAGSRKPRAAHPTYLPAPVNERG